MSESEPPKGKENARAHAAVYMLAMAYLAYLTFQIVSGYLAGGPEAPSFALTAGGVLVLGGGCVLLGVLAHRISAVSAGEGEKKDMPEEEQHPGK